MFCCCAVDGQMEGLVSFIDSLNSPLLFYQLKSLEKCFMLMAGGSWLCSSQGHIFFMCRSHIPCCASGKKVTTANSSLSIGSSSSLDVD